MNKIKFVTYITSLMLAVCSYNANANASVFGYLASKVEKTVHDKAASSDAMSLYSNKQKQLNFDSCKEQFPNNKPIDPRSVSAKYNPLALCSDNFAVLYSQTTKTPIVVFERLNATQIAQAKGEQRTNQFFADPRIPANGRSELEDYKGHNVDRGHNAPAGDMPSSNAMAQSFALSNMIPQDQENNRKVWSKIESNLRKYVARADGNVYVFTGPIYTGNIEKIGPNKVWVPTSIFKLVYDESSKRAWAYILPNAPTQVQKPVDYETFVKATGLQLLSGLQVKN